jgi:hypothetical protein
MGFDTPAGLFGRPIDLEPSGRAGYPDTFPIARGGNWVGHAAR